MFIGLDIETVGTQDHPEYALQPWRVKSGEARITAISVVTEHDQTLLSKLWPDYGDLVAILHRLSNFRDAVIVGWNTIFDAAFIIACGLEREVRLLKWADGLTYRKVLENHPDKVEKGYWGLKQSVRNYLPELADYETEIKERDDWSVVDDTLLKYNHTDAYATARIARRVFDSLNDGERVLAAVVNSGIIPCAQAWLNGLEINVPALDTWSMSINERRMEALKRLSVDHGLETEKVLSSPAQLLTWLHQKGFPVECTDKNELTKFVGNPLMDAVLAYKKARTAETKYINGTRVSLNYNGGTTTHPQPRIFNTYTGRDGYSSKLLKKFPVGVAIHQWPKRGGKAPRMVLQAPQGFLLCECDFATNESRLLADWSDDPVLLDIFNQNLDFHSYMAAVIEGCSYENFLSAYTAGDKAAKELRQCAKVVNLSLTYRASWKRLIDMARTDYELHFTETQAQEYHALYRSTYREVPEYWQRSINIAQMVGYAETRGSRKVLIKDWSRAKSWASESTALNFPIQGTGADMKSLGRGIIDPILYKNGGRYLLDLHDANFFLVPDNTEGVALAMKCRDVLSNLPYEKVFGWRPKVPMPVDLKIGKVWANLEEVK
jgi:DNA polymerase I-like protein with 3'-5' exonuclease and polymerase domains